MRYGRQAYWAWRMRGEYYAWCARKGLSPAGADPYTGAPWPRAPYMGLDLDCQLGRACSIAAARFCYAMARTVRKGD